jgi:hypothetical protein
MYCLGCNAQYVCFVIAMRTRERIFMKFGSGDCATGAMVPDDVIGLDVITV